MFHCCWGSPLKNRITTATLTAVVWTFFMTASSWAQEAQEEESQCGAFSFGCKAAESAKTAVSGLLGKLIDLILTLATQLFAYLMDFFRRDPASNLDSIKKSIQWLQESTNELVVYAIAFSIVIGAGQIAVANIDQQMQRSTETSKAVFKAALVTTAGAPILIVLIEATDALSNYFFEKAGDIEKAKDSIQEMLIKEDSELTTERLLLVVIAVMAIFAFLDLLMQLFIRQFLLIAGIILLPIAGAATTGEQGQAVWSATLRLLTGLLLFKPICAMVFSIGIRYANDKPADAGNDFVTVLLFIAPVMALPIILQLVGSAGGGNSGAGMAAFSGTTSVLKKAGGIGKAALGMAGKAGKIGLGAGAIAGRKLAGGGSGGSGGPTPGNPYGASGGGGRGGRGGGGGSRSGGGGGSGGPKPTPPPAMKHRSPTSQPKKSISSAKPSGNGGGKAGKAGSSASPTQKSAATKTDKNTPTPAGTTPASGGEGNNTVKNASLESASPPPKTTAGQSSMAQDRERLNNQWSGMYPGQKVSRSSSGAKK